MSHDGASVLHRTRPAAPEAFLTAVAPDREGLVVAVEGLFTGSWLADRWADQGLPFGLGHALYRKAIHGGKAKHDHIDSHTMAARLRGGMLPQASGYPAQLRATCDRLRRRTHLMRNRADLLAHVQQTTSPYTRPEIGKKSASRANRAGGAERFRDPAVHKTIAVDLARITSDAELLKELELSSLKTAKPHAAQTLDRLHTVPGIGTSLSLVWLDEMHQIDRFPRVQDVAA